MLKVMYECPGKMLRCISVYQQVYPHLSLCRLFQGFGNHMPGFIIPEDIYLHMNNPSGFADQLQQRIKIRFAATYQLRCIG
jgi:hypothetical protein